MCAAPGIRFAAYVLAATVKMSLASAPFTAPTPERSLCAGVVDAIRKKYLHKLFFGIANDRDAKSLLEEVRRAPQGCSYLIAGGAGVRCISYGGGGGSSAACQWSVADMRAWFLPCSTSSPSTTTLRAM